MTNLTSEQYRDILKHIPDCTEEIPTVQHLLRRAVQTFYKRFGGYPEFAGVAPGKVGLFGEQTQFSEGLALPVATPMATIIVGRRVGGSRYSVVTSADVGKPHKVKFSFSSNRPLGPGSPGWLNYIKGAIDNYGEEVPPFEAAIESSVPIGVGFGSSSAIEVATYSFLEVLVGKKADPIDKAKALQKAEKDFANKNVGLVDRITSILAKDRHAMLIDCKTNEAMWIPFRNPKVTMVAVDSHLKDTFYEDEYPERTRYLAKACEILGVENLRACTEIDLDELQNKVSNIIQEEERKAKEMEENNKEEEQQQQQQQQQQQETEIWTKEDYDVMIKRARFYITEMNRINEAIEAWNQGDVETFGEKMKESHKSLKEDFEFKNPVLDFLVETSLQVEGVLGSRMTGMGLGFGGGIVSLVSKDNVEQYCRYLTEKFAEHEAQLTEEYKESRQEQTGRQYEIKRKFYTKHFNPAIHSSEKIGECQDLIESGATKCKNLKDAVAHKPPSNGSWERRKIPCIVKVEKPPEGCGTWDRVEKEQEKEEFLRRKALRKTKREKEERRKAKERELEELKQSASMIVSEVPDVPLKGPNFYIVSPFAGTRMMFVTKTDILRSLYASPLLQPKTLVRYALDEYEATYKGKVEAIGLAPATLCLFGDFLEFHLGNLIYMALPMFVVTVGGRSDSVHFSVKTTSKEVEEPNDLKIPIPSVGKVGDDPRSWVNLVTGTVKEFKAHVPGFNGVLHSNVPIQKGLHSCAALQASLYSFLETLTMEYSTGVFEKAEKCCQMEYEFLSLPKTFVRRCPDMKFYPVFLCKEGHLMLINTKKHKISNYYFDDPAFVFLLASCKKNTNDITIEALEKRLYESLEALEIMDKSSLLQLDMKHLRCLKKRDASEETIKRVKYIISEHQRTVEAIKAIENEDYARVGLLMSQSHASLRDDYEVSSPEIEALIELALSAEGVLGAKLIGKGLAATIVILIRISEVDKCIRYMRKNYKDRTDKPVFYITKPAKGAFAMRSAMKACRQELGL